MQLYIVMRNVEYEFNEVVGIFSAPEKAEACKSNQEDADTWTYYTIDTWTLDQEK